MEWTEKQRAAFLRHENEQRLRESQLPFAKRLELVANMWATARMFGHLNKPKWAETQKW